MQQLTHQLCHLRGGPEVTLQYEHVLSVKQVCEQEENHASDAKGKKLVCGKNSTLFQFL